MKTELILKEFKQFLEWEGQTFKNWEKVEVFVADTLSEA